MPEGLVKRYDAKVKRVPAQMARNVAEFQRKLCKRPGCARVRLVQEAAALPVWPDWQFDSVIVDEGQNFRVEWRDLVFRQACENARILWLEDTGEGGRSDLSGPLYCPSGHGRLLRVRGVAALPATARAARRSGRAAGCSTEESQ